MIDLKEIRKEFADCPCGNEHTLSLEEIVSGRNIAGKTGEILKRNGFGKRLLLVADENTLKASNGILESLKDFCVKTKVYPSLREATLSEAENVKTLLKDSDAVIAVGTGSLHDICRKAAADLNKRLCLFATAPSMDGFASYCAPLTDGNFKITYAAKTPEVIVADTEILAAAPKELKSAGFGDMVGKYVGLIDWQVSHLITGEYYCERVAALTRSATDRIMSLADKITEPDPEVAQAVFEALILTGIGMSLTKTSRPASGTEHTLSHFWECKKLLEGKISDFHGKKVGVATLLVMKYYERLVLADKIKAHAEKVDWDDVYSHYGALRNEAIKYNTPDTITDGIDPSAIENGWDKIRKIVKSVPSYEQIYAAMKKAGCALTPAEIGVSDELCEEGFRYHPYMRRRMSLLRLSNMFE